MVCRVLCVYASLLSVGAFCRNVAMQLQQDTFVYSLFCALMMMLMKILMTTCRICMTSPSKSPNPSTINFYVQVSTSCAAAQLPERRLLGHGAQAQDGDMGPGVQTKAHVFSHMFSAFALWKDTIGQKHCQNSPTCASLSVCMRAGLGHACAKCADCDFVTCWCSGSCCEVSQM